MRTRIVLFGLSLLASHLALAQMPPRPQPSPEQRLERLTALLDLSAQQQTQIAQVLKEQQAQMETNRPSPEDMRARREQMRKAMADKMSAILSPEQMKKFEALEQDRPEPRFPPRGAGVNKPGRQ